MSPNQIFHQNDLVGVGDCAGVTEGQEVGQEAKDVLEGDEEQWWEGLVEGRWSCGAGHAERSNLEVLGPPPLQSSNFTCHYQWHK